MKSLFITILIIGGAFLGYDYFLAPPGQKVVFTDLNPPKKDKTAPTSVAEPQKPEEPAPEPAAPKQVEAPKPKPAPVPTPAPTPAPSPVASAKPKPGSIEALTDNWQKFPESVFPREVTLKTDAEFKMAAGTSKMAAGRKVQALAYANGMLALAPAQGSSARATVGIDDTDLKTVLTDIYENWKVQRAEYLKQVAAKRALNRPAAATTMNANTAEVDPAGKPLKASDGTYPLLMASMRRGQVTEITPSNITFWNDPKPAKLQGKDGWAVRVEFTAKTIFGPQPTEAQALVVNGQVQGWFFTGSGEEVP